MLVVELGDNIWLVECDAETGGDDVDLDCEGSCIEARTSFTFASHLQASAASSACILSMIFAWSCNFSVCHTKINWRGRVNRGGRSRPGECC